MTTPLIPGDLAALGFSAVLLAALGLFLASCAIDAWKWWRS